MQNLDISLKILNPKIAEFLPKYATVGSAAVDISACIDTPLVLEPNKTILIPSGFAIHINNANFAAVILPRSGLGHKNGIILGNTIGLIDSDYQGEIKVSLFNRSQEAFEITPFMRIAQMMFIPVQQVNFLLVDDFAENSQRNIGGFGSTGV